MHGHMNVRSLMVFWGFPTKICKHLLCPPIPLQVPRNSSSMIRTPYCLANSTNYEVLFMQLFPVFASLQGSIRDHLSPQSSVNQKSSISIPSLEWDQVSHPYKNIYIFRLHRSGNGSHSTNLMSEFLRKRCKWTIVSRTIYFFGLRSQSIMWLQRPVSEVGSSADLSSPDERGEPVEITSARLFCVRFCLSL